MTSLSAELLADEKERAEHVMLVDLGRNDVGRVAKYGTVKVTELMKVEKYSHVLHIVSQVEGELNDGLSALDVFRATFPAGTMTGAPKIRAMEIIDELEPVSRGPYAGAIGYIAAGGKRMDLAITIRTCIIADGMASVQAGAGIVADSVPEREWDETRSKAQALLSAIASVRQRAEAAQVVAIIAIPSYERFEVGGARVVATTACAGEHSRACWRRNASTIMRRGSPTRFRLSDARPCSP